MASFPISNDRINLDLFPPEPCPALPTQGQIWPQGLFLGSYANLSNPTPPPPTDPYWGDVARLYSFSNEPITDASLSGSNPTLVNDVQIVNDQSPFAGGGSSAYFNGTSSYIEIPTISLSSFTDFTVEFWIRPEEGSRIHTVLIDNPSYASEDRILVDNFNRFIVSNNTNGPTVTAGVWHHLAFVRSSNVEKGYVNGVGYTYGVEFVERSYDRIGNVIADGSPVWYLKGWLSNMRITPGIARYTADFTPPTAPFPNS